MKKILFTIILLLNSISLKPDIHTFVLEDKTNELPYSSEFDCKDFTETFINNARAIGIDAFSVGVGWRVEGKILFHQFVGIQSHGEIIWLEPQTDQFYAVTEAGKPLCVIGGECVTDNLVFIHIDN